jgi:acyl carrier protein
MELQKSVKRVIAEQLGVDESEVVDDANLVNHLGADSLDAVEVVMAMEEEFSIEIPDEVAEKLQTVGQVVECVRQKVDAMRDPA